jgi:hypothetical protein
VADATEATRYAFNEDALENLPPDKRRMAIRALAEMSGGVRGNALFQFDPLDPNGSGVPHIPQHQWLSAWKTPDGKLTKFRLFAGGNRAGKTTAGDVGLIIDCCDEDAVPPHLRRYKRWHTPIQCYLVAVSGRAVEKIHLPIFRKWVPKDQLVGGSFEKAYNKEYQTSTSRTARPSTSCRRAWTSTSSRARRCTSSSSTRSRSTTTAARSSASASSAWSTTTATCGSRSRRSTA